MSTRALGTTSGVTQDVWPVARGGTALESEDVVNSRPLLSALQENRLNGLPGRPWPLSRDPICRTPRPRPSQTARAGGTPPFAKDLCGDYTIRSKRSSSSSTPPPPAPPGQGREGGGMPAQGHDCWRRGRKGQRDSCRYHRL